MPESLSEVEQARLAHQMRLSGPIAVVRSELFPARRGYVVISASALSEVIHQGGRISECLPTHIAILGTEYRQSTTDIGLDLHIHFSSPSCRELTPGEPIPRWTLKYASNDYGYWWEEVR